MTRPLLVAIAAVQLAAAQPGPWEPLSAQSKWTGGIGIPFPAKAWVVEGDTLHLVRPKLGGSLYSAAQFDNFELAFEWRIAPAGNSGVKYMGVAGRVHPDFHRFVTRPAAARLALVVIAAAAAMWLLRKWRRPRWQTWAVAAVALGWMVFSAVRYYQSYARAGRHPAGLEYQLTDDERNPDALSKPTHRTAALYDMLAPAGSELRPVGEFNDSRIVVNGPRAEHWLNGRKVVEYEFGSAALRRAVSASKFSGEPGFAVKSSGYLELQNHGDEVWFRNMRIRRF